MNKCFSACPLPDISGTNFAIEFLHGIRKRTITSVFAHGGFVVRPYPDCFFAGLASCHHPLHGPPDLIEPKAGSLGGGVVPNAATVSYTKAPSVSVY
jgi:hypothetical protein